MSEEKNNFPENALGLKRGSLIISNHPEVEAQLGVKVGQPIPIGYDGIYVRCMGFTWSIEQLVEEIQAGYWKISNEVVDLTDEINNKKFTSLIEKRP